MWEALIELDNGCLLQAQKGIQLENGFDLGNNQHCFLRVGRCMLDYAPLWSMHVG